MSDIVGIENISNEIKNKLDSGKDILLFAFNATGKTRLSRTFDSELGSTALCYNAYMEDSYNWENDAKILRFADVGLFSFIQMNGLDHQIVDIFKMCVGSKVEPYIDFSNNIIEFKLATGDNESKDNVKISKGEESLFKWAVYYVIIDQALQGYQEGYQEFQNLKYIIIDDPITSLDDYRVCIVASQIISLIKYARNKNLPVRFLITTHHLMFFNILRSSMQNDIDLKREKKIFYKMEKVENDIVCESVNSNKMMVYHLHQLIKIKKSIQRDNITKNLFNILRSVLEKMAVILGYNHWSSMYIDFKSNNRLKYEMFINALNMNSHNQYSDIDSVSVPEDQKSIFIEGFNFFIKKYNVVL